MTDHSEEFDCCECGSHIVRIIAEPKSFKLCAQCIFLPGWFSDPRLVALIDPDWRPPAAEEPFRWL